MTERKFEFYNYFGLSILPFYECIVANFDLKKTNQLNDLKCTSIDDFLIIFVASSTTEKPKLSSADFGWFQSNCLWIFVDLIAKSKQYPQRLA